MPHQSSRHQVTPSPVTKSSSIFDAPGPEPETKPDIPVVLISGRHDDDASSSSSSSPTSGNDANYRQLRELVSSMRSRLAAVRMRADRDSVREEDLELKAAYALFVQIGGQCRALCQVLVAEDGGRERKSAGDGGRGRGRMGSVTSGKVFGVDGVGVGKKGHVRRVTSAGVGSVKLDGGEGEGGGDGSGCGTARKQVNGAWVAAVREWRACLEELAAAHKLCLTNTYKRHEQFATPEILDALFADRKSRGQVVSGWMKNFGAYKRMQGQSGVWSKWGAQFQNYEQIVHELAEITCLLQGLDSGITPNRVINEITIAPRGDTVLEFANMAMDWKPVLRFRVSSHMLAETSPIFASMFSRHSEQEAKGDGGAIPPGEDEEDILPPPPTPFICKDGTRTLLYRMPQLEVDKESALTILLHAAHMHNDRVPREVSFEQFVTLAEASLLYKCTSPLELFVEHRWLPQWVHKATDAMPDGLVVISYAFGLRRLFTRVTKTAILNLVDERELAGKDWPKGIKERIWAVRCAKMAQVYQTCARAVEEYLQPPLSASAETTTSDAMEGVTGRSQTSTPVGSPPRSPSRPVSSYTASITPSIPSIFSQTNSTTTTFLNHSPSPGPFSSTPRCPKGSHWCDATNLGWLMLVYNSLHILSPFLNPDTLSVSTDPPPPRSLAQIVESLRSMASPPPHPDHRFSSVCDPAPAFRAAINDVYNSVSGLTLFEIDGTRHGWALSARHAEEPQAVHRIGGAANKPAGPRQTEAGTVDELTAAMGGLGLAEGESGAVTTAMESLVLSETEEGSNPAAPRLAPAEEALRDEGICLRVLGSVDAFPDLHSAAVVNRNMYAVYKQNELELMRNVVRADRRRTVMLLVGNKGGGDGSEAMDEQKSRPPLSPDVDRYLQRLIQEGPKPPPSSADDPSVSGDDYVSVSADAESDSGTETVASTTSESTSNTPVRTESPAPSSSALSSRRSLHSTRSHRSTASSSVNPYFKMTEEEGRRILWGEPSPPLSPLLSAPEVLAFRAVSHVIEEEEKFGGTGGLFVEDKMLVTGGNKQLREDMDRRMGLG